VELHEQSFSLLQRIILQSLNPRPASAPLTPEQCTMYLSLATSALQLLQRHLSPLNKAARSVREQLLPASEVQKLYTLLSVTVPRLMTAADSDFPNVTQRKVWREMGDSMLEALHEALHTGFDVFFPSTIQQVRDASL
jgi:hypothetical protein